MANETNTDSDLSTANAASKYWESLELGDRRIIASTSVGGLVVGYGGAYILHHRRAGHNPSVPESVETRLERAEANSDLLADTYRAVAIKEDPSYIEGIEYDGKDHAYTFPEFYQAKDNSDLNDHLVQAQADPVIGSYIVRVRQADSTAEAIQVLIDAESVNSLQVEAATEAKARAESRSRPDAFGSFLLGTGVFTAIFTLGAVAVARRRQERKKKQRQITEQVIAHGGEDIVAGVEDLLRYEAQQRKQGEEGDTA